MRLLLWFTFYFSLNILFAQTESLPSEVVASIHQRIESGSNPSIVVGIIDKDGPQYFAFGKKKSRGKKVNEHTIYEIGSISKTFTAIILADMHNKQQVNINDPVEKFLPAHVKMPMYENQKITLGHLSDHTSSLPRLPNNFTPADQGNPYADFSMDKLYSFLSNYQLTRPIGSEYEYSNVAVGLLGHILSLVSGKSYEDLIVSTIASPLQMNETRIRLTKKMKKNLATGHAQGEQVPNWDLGSIEGAGGIRSSLHDMVTYIGANMNLHKYPMTDAMNVTHMARHNKAGSSRVGLGWHIDKGKEGDIIWHNGGTGGYSTFAGFNKEKRIGVVVLTNSTEHVDDIGFHLLDGSLPLRNVVPDIAIKLKELIDQEGVKDLTAKYANLKNTSAEKYAFTEAGINSLGYYYLNRKKFAEAEALLLLNVREHPKSSNVYDSYGEVLMEKGEKERAIENYKKSLEINPGNTNAVAMLLKMGVTYTPENVQVADSVLASYVGTYEITPGFDIVINKEGNQLYAKATGQSAYPIFPSSDTQFYLKVVEASIVFNTNSQGKVVSLTLDQGGNQMEGKKYK